MRRTDLRDFHYITRIENICSILTLGILSNELAMALRPISFAMESAQERRSRKMVTPGRNVHSYANVYFDAHNPTLSARRRLNARLAVLQVASSILDIPGTYIAPQNAASDGVVFHPSPGGLAYIDAARVYAEWWTTDPDPSVTDEWSRQKCAEVLVPGVIPATYITGAFVCSPQAATELSRIAPHLSVRASPSMFF